MIYRWCAWVFALAGLTDALIGGNITVAFILLFYSLVMAVVYVGDRISDE